MTSCSLKNGLQFQNTWERERIESLRENIGFQNTSFQTNLCFLTFSRLILFWRVAVHSGQPYAGWHPLEGTQRLVSQRESCDFLKKKNFCFIFSSLEYGGQKYECHLKQCTIHLCSSWCSYFTEVDEDNMHGRMLRVFHYCSDHLCPPNQTDSTKLYLATDSQRPGWVPNGVLFSSLHKVHTRCGWSTGVVRLGVLIFSLAGATDLLGGLSSNDTLLEFSHLQNEERHSHITGNCLHIYWAWVHCYLPQQTLKREKRFQLC